jgi:hypothetical protein
MHRVENIEIPFKGKTYSLYGTAKNSDGYYKVICDLTNALLFRFGNEKDLLSLIQSLISRKGFLKDLLRNKNAHSFECDLMKMLDSTLHKYTLEVNNHLKDLTLSEKFEKVFTLTEQQYHLLMIKIELINRIHINEFKGSNYKIAFLPHCLHDLDKNCTSKPDEIDYVCRSCSKNCNINFVCSILKENNINPYIWRIADLKKLIRNLKEKYISVGVFGIACIPELINGMELCARLNVPVTGLPLDANRCSRWMGEFHFNTANLSRLRSLLA